MERTEMTASQTTAYQALATAFGDRACRAVEQAADQGLVRAVEAAANAQIKREEESRALAPEAYRLSNMSDASVDIRYRHGKENMSALDLIHYISDTRAMRLQNMELSEDTGIDVCTEQIDKATDKALAPVEKTRANEAMGKGLLQIPQKACKELCKKMPVWFDAAEADTSSNSRRFPLSAFAAMLAVAVSLLLIVASSVMVRLAETDISRLKEQISTVSVQAADMKSDLEVGQDILQIRQIATEEYGMVAEDFVKMDYISLRGEDSVEVYKEEREERMGLSALLSAIGLK